VQSKSRSSISPEARETILAVVAWLILSLSASNSYRLLEPGPVVLVVTKQDDKQNVMTMGFHMVMQHDPPLIGAIIGPWDHSYAALRATKECVIAIPSVKIAETVVDIRNCSSSDTDKFDKFDLRAVEADKVKVPLFEGCLACLEAKVEETKMVSKYNMKVIKAWVDDKKISNEKMFHHRGDGTFVVDGDILDLRENMTLWKEFQD
jgi:flavin reductase (DIM6/NTAB) family NADH-FMN oxidoreductase RutF